MPIDRPRGLRLPLTDEELEMLRALAAANHTTMADVLRTYIRKAFAKQVKGARGTKEE